MEQCFNTPMLGIGTTRTLLAALLGICELSMLHAARAQPPITRAEAPMQKITAAWSHASMPESRTATLAQRLDLRPPSEILAGEQAPGNALGNHRLFGGESPVQAEARAPSPQSGHIMSPMETVVHNFHQEGLPVAKLFQNNTSLVHIGLNPKGKPGLWIVHKTR
jgi:hypothetical protein